MFTLKEKLQTFCAASRATKAEGGIGWLEFDASLRVARWYLQISLVLELIHRVAQEQQQRAWGKSKDTRP